VSYPFHKRDEWAVRHPSFGHLSLPVRKVFAHHTAGQYMAAFDPPAMRALEEAEIARGGGYVAVAYHTLIDGDGSGVECRPVTAMGGATLNQNTVSIAIVLPGDYTHGVVSLAQNDSAAEWLTAAAVYGVITTDFQLLPHSAVFATECPGRFIDNLGGIRADVANRLHGASPVKPPVHPIPPGDPNVFLEHLAYAVGHTRFFIAQGFYVMQGSHNDAVWTVQIACLSDGESPGAIDSSFGPKTLAAVEAYQAKHGLTVDGVVGRQTYGHMYPTV